MRTEIVAETYTACIETYNLSPTPEEFLRLYDREIRMAIRDKARIDWAGCTTCNKCPCKCGETMMTTDKAVMQ